MSEITTTIDNNTYQEINLNDHPLISDDQPNVPNIFDARAKLYMNGNGEVVWTTSGSSENALNRDNPLVYPKYYNFDKPNQENGNSFTSLGKAFFTKNIPNDEKVEHLKKVEKELTEILNNEYEKRKKTNPNQVQPNITISKAELEEEENKNIAKARAYLKEEILEDYMGLHNTDSFLQRLSLKNLKYPIDADYGNTQDYIQINQFTYKASSSQILFPEGGKDAVFQQFGETITSGLTMDSQKEKFIGLTKLPMPNDLTDSNNVAWGEDQLNAITAAAATVAAGGVDKGIQVLKDIQNKDKTIFEGLGELLTGGKEGFGKVIEQLTKASGTPQAELLGRSVVGSGLLNLAGFGLSPEAILARGAGIIPNSNLQLLFNAPTLRAFRFNWKMSPRSQEEAIRINNIIRFFKQGMAVKKRKGSGTGGSYFLATPNVFDISFRTSKTKQEITNTNNSVLRMKTCACVGAAVNYTPQGMWNAYEKGQPTSCILSLQFKELEPIYNTDYDEDPFNYNDLTGFVPENAVGY